MPLFVLRYEGDHYASGGVATDKGCDTNGASPVHPHPRFKHACASAAVEPLPRSPKEPHSVQGPRISAVGNRRARSDWRSDHRKVSYTSLTSFRHKYSRPESRRRANSILLVVVSALCVISIDFDPPLEPRVNRAREGGLVKKQTWVWNHRN